MCLIETKIYVSSSGSEWEQEIVHPCERATSKRLCDNTVRKSTRAGLIERRSSKRRRSDRPTSESTTQQDSPRPQRSEERRVVIERSRYVVEQGSPESSSSSSPSRRRVYPAAPSPPLPSRNEALQCPLKDCPMMSGGLGSDHDTRPPLLEHDFIKDSAELTQRSRPTSLQRQPSTRTGETAAFSGDRKKRLTVEIPANEHYATFKLEPPPLRRKSVKLEDRRDSAKAFPSSSRYGEELNDARHREAADRARVLEEESRERYEAYEEAARIRQEAAEDAKWRRVEGDEERRTDQMRRLDYVYEERMPEPAPLPRRSSQTGQSGSDARRRANEAAARNAQKAGERVHHSVVAERRLERRIDGERREKERQAADAKRREQDMVLRRREDDFAGPHNPLPRKTRAPPIYHYEDPMPSRDTGYSQRARGEELIASAQAQMARDELAATLQDLTLGNPVVDTGRRDRIRRFRDDQR